MEVLCRLVIMVAHRLTHLAYGGAGGGEGVSYIFFISATACPIYLIFLFERGENGESFCNCQLEKILILHEVCNSVLCISLKTSTFSNINEYRHS